MYPSSPQFLPFFFPAKERAACAPDRGLLRLIHGQLILLAAAHSRLVDEETAAAWGPLDRAAPSGPLQPLHRPLGGQYPYGAVGRGWGPLHGLNFSVSQLLSWQMWTITGLPPALEGRKGMILPGA